jgi:MerR family transcriptional regulator, heat shock protein HspR
MERDSEQGLYFISIAARLAEVHPQTLRMYERKGLLRPKRTLKNRRRYSDSDIERLRRIQELTQVKGLNLSGVQMVLEMEAEIEALRSRVARLEKELLEAKVSLKEEMALAKRKVALSRRPDASLVRASRKRLGGMGFPRD